MNNIAKHSEVNQVYLSLKKEENTLELTIRDNGQGFDLAKIKNGMGLSTMRERTQLSGGTYTIESAKEEGTTIRASWPLVGNG